MFLALDFTRNGTSTKNKHKIVNMLTYNLEPGYETEDDNTCTVFQACLHCAADDRYREWGFYPAWASCPTLLFPQE